MFRYVAASLLGIFLCSTRAQGAPLDELRHADLAQKWLRARGIEASAPRGLELQGLVREQFVHLGLGAFELYFPDSILRDNARVEDLVQVLVSLLSAQARWIEWLPEDHGSSEDRKAFSMDVKTVTPWLKKLKGGTFAPLAPLAGKDLLEALTAKEAKDAKDKVRLAFDSLARALHPGGPFGSRLGDAKPATLVLLPTRADFVEFACVVGWVIEIARAAYWSEDLFNWTSIDFEGIRALPLQYAAPEARQDYTKGLSMNSRNPKGLVQHVTQLAMRSLFESNFGKRLEPMVAAGMANSFLIEEFGEIDTRTDGDLRSSSVSGRSMFIPASMGGQSSGGALPPGNADSRWRKERGQGHFLRELRAAQKHGEGKVKKNETGLHFLLESDSGVSGHAVRAPFLGLAGNETLPPESYRGDHLEFLRAYRCGFLYWLRTQAAGRGKESKEHFARLLSTLGDPARADVEFLSALRSVYGVPLSSASPGKDDLEGRFLRWLAKLK